jgi:hypothetical protein
MCWHSPNQVPQWARDEGLVGNCIPVVDGTDQPDPFLSGFYWATSNAFDAIFGPLLGPEWFEDAIFSSDPPVEI